jgi:hypothetical protein
MHTRVLIAGMVLFGTVGSAAADTYYVTRDPQTKHCTIVTERPADRAVVTQIGPLAFTTREEAQERMRRTEVCTTEEDDDDDDASPPRVIERR